jgi:protease I
VHQTLQQNVHQTMPGRRVGFLVAPEGIKRTEFTTPWRAVQETGVQPELVAEIRDIVRAFDDQNQQWNMYVDKVFAQTDVDDYDGLVLTGGGFASDTLNTLPEALRLVREFVVDEDKPVGAIGQSVRTLSEAGAVSGRRISCAPDMEAGLRDAGAECVDEDVVVHDGLVTSRSVDAVDGFCRALVAEFAQWRIPAKAGRRPRHARGAVRA